MERERVQYATFVKTTVLGIQVIAAVGLMAGIVLYGSFLDGGMRISTQPMRDYPMALFAGILMVGMLVVWVACLSYLSVAAGQHRDDRSIHLVALDHWHTEVHIGMLAIWCIFMYYLSAKIHVQEYTVMGRIVVSGSMGFMSDIVFMVLYLSMVRMAKAGILIQNSIICHVVIALWEMIKEHARNSVILIIGVILTLVTGYFAFWDKKIWLLILMLLLGFFTFEIYLRFSRQHRNLRRGLMEMKNGNLKYQFRVEEFTGDDRQLVRTINQVIRDLNRMAEEATRDERMKADMITNISHDIKTPLTSIINYTGLLKREEIDNPKVLSYIDVLEQKSMRLKTLMEDLLEVSRISSGNIALDMYEIDMVELVCQTGGEFNEKLEDKGLTVVTKFPREPAIIRADGNQLWRVVGNLYNNLCKYALTNSTVHVEMEVEDGEVILSVKNKSERKVEVEAELLTERFVRGDVARSTEGSGLGLSISKMLTVLMGGTFNVEVDGELFCVEVKFPLINQQK